MGKLSGAKSVIVMILIFICLIIGLLVITYLKQSEYNKLVSDRSQSESTLKKKKAIELELPALETEIVALQDDIEEFRRMLPQQDAQATMITMFTELEERHGVHIQRTEQIGSSQSGEYIKTGLRLSITNTPFYSFCEFINAIEQSKRLFIVNDFTLTGAPREARNVPLTINMVVYTYYYSGA